MLQKTQFTLAISGLAFGAALCLSAGPAHGQKRIRLTAPVTTQLPTGTGIVKPPSSPAPIVTPPVVVTQPAVVPPPPAPIVPPPAPVVTPPSTSLTLRTTPTTLRRPIPTPPPVTSPYQPAPQGVSAGPTLLGQSRLNVGHLVNRVPPDFNGDGQPDLHKIKGGR